MYVCVADLLKKPSTIPSRLFYIKFLFLFVFTKTIQEKKKFEMSRLIHSTLYHTKNSNSVLQQFN